MASMAQRTKFVGGNWKMNTRRDSGAELAREVRDGLADGITCEAMVFPPLPYLTAVHEITVGSRLRLGAQNVWHEPDGARTGEVSMGMLQNCGATGCLTGHSERRHVIGESDELVGLKTRHVLESGLTCVLCIGETIEEREDGRTNDVNERQLEAGLVGVDAEGASRLVIAYEPVWAIGTGRTATPEDAQAAHAHIRNWLRARFDPTIGDAMRIIYGGSVKGSNAKELFAQPDIDGGLIGGASLKASEFIQIVEAACA